MKKFIPKQKLSKKEAKARNALKRKSWGNISPVTKTVKSAKIYNRKKNRYNDLSSIFHGSCFLSVCYSHKIRA